MRKHIHTRLFHPPSHTHPLYPPSTLPHKLPDHQTRYAPAPKLSHQHAPRPAGGISPPLLHRLRAQRQHYPDRKPHGHIHQDLERRPRQRQLLQTDRDGPAVAELDDGEDEDYDIKGPAAAKVEEDEG